MPQNHAKQPRHLVTGAEGEKKAASFLKKSGMKILERNWRPPGSFGPRAGSLELDIVALAGDTLVFVEVKSRHDAPGSGFAPLDAFGKSKQKRILKAASIYLEANESWHKPCRFDLVCIVFKPDNSVVLEHHENVLSFESPNRGAVGGGNAPWQPW